MRNLTNPVKIAFFLFSKITIFSSILLFQIFGFDEEYIFLEKNIAIALFLLNFFIVGTTTSYANTVVVRKLPIGHSLIALHINIALIICFLLLVLSVILQNINYVFISCCLLCMLATKQLSQIKKNENNVILASFFDALFYYFIAFSFLFMFLFDDFLSSLIIFVIFFVAYIFVQNFKRISSISPLKKANFREFYSFAIKSLNITFICSLFILAPRALVDFYVENNSQEEFFLTLRILFSLVLIWQFFDIKYYSKRITLSTKRAVSIGILIFFAVLITGILLLSIFNYLSLVSDQYIIFGAIYVSGWIASAYFEFFIVREKKSLILNISILVMIFALFLASIYSSLPMINILMISLLLFPFLMLCALLYKPKF